MIANPRLRGSLPSISTLTVIAVAGLAFAGDAPPSPKGIDAKTAYAKLKTMVGTWKTSITREADATTKKADHDHHPDQAIVDFKLTGAGSALVETQFPGKAHEMVSVYHLDGDELRMTHYCAAGNQPRLKLDRAHSTPDHFVFVFDGGSNLDPAKDMHIHALDISFKPDGLVSSVWQGYMDGKKADASTFAMTRNQ